MFKRIVLGVLSLLTLWLLFEWATFPDVSSLAARFPATTSFMEIRRQEFRAASRDGTIHYNPVVYEQISPYLRRAVLVAEDDTFYEHGGVDVEALKDALRRDWKRKRISHGGSTITQQLAKNLFLSPSRNPLRKLKEFLITRSLENHLTKKRILELYLNVVEMGERVYGAEAASRRYFRRPAATLTAAQAALLAGCLPNPRLLSPSHPNRRLRARQAMILSRMRRWGYLAEEAVLAAPRPRVRSVKPAPPAPPPLATPPDERPPLPNPAEPSETSTLAVPPVTSSPSTMEPLDRSRQ